MDSIMRLESLSKVYQTGDVKVRAVDGISLRIARGAFIAVTGPSGSGKSTLLHLMGGLDRPTEGSVIYQDKNLYDYRDNQLSVLRRRRFGFVFQSYNLIKELTGMEYILLPVMLDRRKADEGYINLLLDMLDIRDRAGHLPDAMSGGQQQRFAIARALANKPDLLFADEPTGNLDGQAGREVLALLQYAGRELGLTLVLVTHDLSIAEQAGRVIRLADGRVVADTGGEAGV
ncbi:MAG: ABC transporter ATP-binding protein [Clostridiales bacterium]|nr:ABC transporter ATP-binding protein [Clostridiales bacterium]